MKKQINHHKRKRIKQKAEMKAAERVFPTEAFDEYCKNNMTTVSFAVYDALLDKLQHGRFFIDQRKPFGKPEKQEIRGSNIEKFCSELNRRINVSYLEEILPELPHVVENAFLRADDITIAEFITMNSRKTSSKLIMRYLRDTKRLRIIVDFIRENLSEHVVFKYLQENPHYKRATQRIEKTMAAKRLLFENIETSTPDDYTELFPLARQMERRFVIHIGPTNSGKTYQAMEEMKKADSGIYLAPLRLLAYEQYEKMNREGTPCSMITGEEQIIMPGSFHQSSTIEMLNISEVWDVAVIDEAQMISDMQRGGYWTTAILGIRAKLIHICASPDAENVLRKMIISCGDTYEVVYHERMTPLVMDEDASDFNFPGDVKPGDALIVFSRKDVHSVAAELQNSGVKCSIIYGALPYDVRHREAKKFAVGETQVVVATDAIGMGMNLPIRRIVFLQTIKFDGVDERPLNASEVKQIAGRAGRFGIYDTGYVTSYYDYDEIKKLLISKMKPLDRVMINIPEEFLAKEGRISEILQIWNRIPAADYYDKGDISEKIRIAGALEKIRDNRELIRQFIRIAANPDNRETFSLYMDYYRMVAEGRTPDINETMALYSADLIEEKDKDALQSLETASLVYDFLYSFTRIFGDPEDLRRILDGKRHISEKIFVILDKQTLNLRECSNCGKKLKWSYKYGICQECFRKRQYERKHMARMAKERKYQAER